MLPQLQILEELVYNRNLATPGHKLANLFATGCEKVGLWMVSVLSSHLYKKHQTCIDQLYHYIDCTTGLMAARTSKWHRN